MPSLAFRKASICSRFSFSASCTLVVNPQHATRSRLILYWKLPPPSGSSCIGKDFLLQAHLVLEKTKPCKSEGRCYAVCRLLQLLPSPSNAARHSCDGSRIDRSRLGDSGTS